MSTSKSESAAGTRIAPHRLEEVRFLTVERLRAREHEIGDAIFAHVLDAVSDPGAATDAEYAEGLRVAVLSNVAYAISSIEGLHPSSRSVPAAAVAQARRAARAGVRLPTVLRRYVLGHALLGEYITVTVAQQLDPAELPIQAVVVGHMLRGSTSLLDRLIVPVTTAYEDEVVRTTKTVTVTPPRTHDPDCSSYEACPAVLLRPNAHRARRCLRYLASENAHGHQPSNAEIAHAIGVKHPSQMSLLLTKLTREDLLYKNSGGTGKRNRWRLSAPGQDAAQALMGSVEAPIEGSREGPPAR